MNWSDWYTDLMDVWRNVDVLDGNLTRQERQKVLTGIPCRIYQSNNKPINMTQTAANVQQNDHLACDISVDIHAGDELIITRGGKLGSRAPPSGPLPATPTSTMSHSGPSCRDWPTRKSG